MRPKSKRFTPHVGHIAPNPADPSKDAADVAEWLKTHKVTQVKPKVLHGAVPYFVDESKGIRPAGTTPYRDALETMVKKAKP